VTLAAVGACTIQATQAGNATYAAAPTVAQSFQVTPANTTLGANALLVGAGAGAASVVLSSSGAWTATANDSFLHISPGSASGAASGVVAFTYDAFTGTGTRTGTLTIAGLTVTVTQAGTNYVGAGPVTTLVSSGLSMPYGPYGVADGFGNVYFADEGNNAIKEWSAATQQVTTLVASGLHGPTGVAVDGSGNIYIADEGNNAIKEWSAATQQVTTLVASGLHGPTGVAVDAAGKVYIADEGDNAIKEWSAATQQVTTLVASGLSMPYGVAVDGAGNVYIADTNDMAIKKWSAATEQVTTLATAGGLATAGVNDPLGVAVDGSGNVYIADTDNEAIQEWSPATQQVTAVLSSGLSFPYGIAVGASGNIYIADGGTIAEIPYAFVGPASLTEPASAGSGSLPQVLPATTNLSGIFAPTSDQSWLTIGTIVNGVVNFSFTANTSSARTAHITLLGRQIPVTQEAQPQGPAATLGSNSMAFPDTIVGAASAIQTATLRNTGNAALSIASIVVTGADAANYRYTVDATNACPISPATLSAGASCTLDVAFAPLSQGTHNNAQLTVTDNSGNAAGATQTFGLTGAGIVLSSITVTAASASIANGAMEQFTATGTYSDQSTANLTSVVIWSSSSPAVAAIGSTGLVTALAIGSTNITAALGPVTSNPFQLTIAPAQQFYPLTPCRVADTRQGTGFTGTQGPPSLSGGTSRTFGVAGYCGVPANATAYSLNVTVVPRTSSLDYLTTWPAGQTMPNASTLNSWTGTAVANAALVPAGTNGEIAIYASDDTDVLFDINGYFAPPGASGLQFYPLTPCRVADTRGFGFTGTQGAPAMAGGTSRNFQVAGLCGVPLTAAAYSLNVTVVPQTASLDYLTTWPTGQTMPNASTLNSWTGTAVANAALVPAGTSGDISIYASDATQVLFDINGYYAPAGTGGLDFYPMTPCRVADTRGFGFTGQFGTPSMAGNTSRSFQVPVSVCNVPPAAQAYSLNVTVVPQTDSLDYLTTWPTGQTMPNASTLNSWTGTVVANAALVPAGTSGAISIYVSDPANVLFDINGYFAPGQ